MVFGKASGFGTVDGSGRQVIDLTTLSAGRRLHHPGRCGGRPGRLQRLLGGRRQRRRLRRSDRRGAVAATTAAPMPARPMWCSARRRASARSTAPAAQVIDLTTLSAADGFIIQGDAAGDRAGFSVSVGGRRQRRRLRRPDRRGASVATTAAPMPARPMWCSARRRASARSTATGRAGDRPHDALGRRRLHHPGRYGGRPGRLQRLVGGRRERRRLRRPDRRARLAATTAAPMPARPMCCSAAPSAPRRRR